MKLKNFEHRQNHFQMEEEPRRKLQGRKQYLFSGNELEQTNLRRCFLHHTRATVGSNEQTKQ